MNLNRYIPQLLKTHYENEILAYRRAVAKGYYSEAWNHLERAHVIGQAYPREHTNAHWQMLRFGIRIKNTREILGQIPRLLVGGIKSFVGKIPVGNTGGANIPPLKQLPIPEDILKIFESAGIKKYHRKQKKF